MIDELSEFFQHLCVVRASLISDNALAIEVEVLEYTEILLEDYILKLLSYTYIYRLLKIPRWRLIFMQIIKSLENISQFKIQ